MTTGWRWTGGGVGLAAALFAGVAAVSLLTTARASTPQEAADLGHRIDAAPEGRVRFQFAAREGVCGDGASINLHRHGEEDARSRRCDDGPIRVDIEKSGRRIVDLDSWVGRSPSSRPDVRTDLGTVGTAEAAAYLLTLSRRADGEVGGDAVGAAALADSVEIWPDLLDVARDDALASDTREAAIFWLSQLAGERATEDLESLVRDDGDEGVRQAALFGLSQLPDGAGLDALLRVARESEDPELVQASLFWLGQTGDPRAIALFEEILTLE
jgi:hypothetical protein